MPAPEILISIIAILILASGFLSLFGQALKAVRKPRLQKEIDDAEKSGSTRRGSRRFGKAGRYRLVLEAIENPSKLFVTIHFWIRTLRTLAAVLAGLSMGHFLAAGAIAPLILLTAALICAILLLGGFIPGIIAQREPEAIASALIPLFPVFFLPLRPFLFFAAVIGKRLRLAFPITIDQQGMTEDELRYALMEGEKSGIVESKERTMVEGVFYLGDRPLGTFMTHRSEVQWLDINAPAGDIREKVLEYRAQRCFPVGDGALDTIIGAAYVEDVILGLQTVGLQANGLQTINLKAMMKKPLFAPETMPALKAFESFRRGKADYLFVMDEYGGFAGMVCVQDLMEEIVGELAAPLSEGEQAVQQKDGSWLSGGGFNIDDAAELFSLPGLAASGDYHTLAGFVLSLAEELPHAGDSFAYQGYRFTVLEMDGNRIDRIAVSREEL